ncbi:MAG: bifunctional pyr operon transcriptional regulator/uracil phosphoribosyltransferase PyrR [Candidatus Margulisiibacteriota bacterium]
MTVVFDAADMAILLSRVSNDLHRYLKAYSNHNIVFVGILTNGLFFGKRIQGLLAKRNYHIDTPVMGLDISLYRDDLESKKKDYLSIGGTSEPINLDGKHVVLFDDVLCTARTARAALNAIFDYGRPEKVSFTVLYDRGHRQVPIEPNVVGKSIDFDMSQRVNVGFLEVTGEDQVELGPF